MHIVTYKSIIEIGCRWLIYNNKNLYIGDFKSVANARDSGFLMKGAPPGRMRGAEELWN